MTNKGMVVTPQPEATAPATTLALIVPAAP